MTSVLFKTDTSTDLALVESDPLENLPVKLSPDELSSVKSEVDSVSLKEIDLFEISNLGSHLEVALHSTIDEFAKKITTANQPKIFELIKATNQTIDNQKLDELADRIINGKPGFFAKLFGKKDKAMSDMFNEIAESLNLKTKTIVSEIEKLQRELNESAKAQKLEIDTLNKLKQKYKDRFTDFCKGSAILMLLVEKSKRELEQMISSKVSEVEINDMKSKIEALESRALMVSSTMLRLPAEQLVITQLEKAGITTYVETTASASNRFASIKMTLLSLNSALVTNALQKHNDSNAEFDKNLLQVRQKLNQKIITNSSSMAGNNRLAQAQNLQSVIQMVKESQQWVKTGEESNQKNFIEVRRMLDTAANDLQALGTAVVSR